MKHYALRSAHRPAATNTRKNHAKTSEQSTFRARSVVISAENWAATMENTSHSETFAAVPRAASAAAEIDEFSTPAHERADFSTLTVVATC